MLITFEFVEEGISFDCKIRPRASFEGYVDQKVSIRRDISSSDQFLDTQVHRECVQNHGFEPFLPDELLFTFGGVPIHKPDTLEKHSVEEGATLRVKLNTDAVAARKVWQSHSIERPLD